MSDPVENDANQRVVNLENSDQENGAAAGVENEPVYQLLPNLLQGRKPFALPEKQELLLGFCAPDIDISSLQEVDVKKPLRTLQSVLLGSKGVSTSPMKRNWQSGYVAHQLTSLFIYAKAYMEQIAALPVTNSTRGRSANSIDSNAKKFLDNLVGKLDVAIEQEEGKVRANEEAGRHRAEEKANAAKKKSGVRPQDNMEFDINKAEKNPCPYCNHYNTMAIESKGEIERINGGLEGGDKRGGRQYKSKTQRGRLELAKPRKSTKKEQTIGCFCFKTNCMMMPDGGNCQRCQLAREDGIGLDHNGCNCEICACPCAETFGRSKRYQIALSMDKYRPEAEEPENPSQFFQYLTSSLVNNPTQTRQGNAFAPEGDIAKDSCSMAAISMAANPKFASASFRNTMQKAMGATIPSTILCPRINTPSGDSLVRMLPMPLC